MNEYLVTWKIDSETDTPLGAAYEAFLAMQMPTSATYFEVYNKKTGETVDINLGDLQDADFIRKGKTMTDCKTCSGLGYVAEDTSGNEYKMVSCHDCEGTGRVK